MMGTGKATKSISCPFCRGKITVTFWWDTGYNKGGSGVGLPPSADMDFEQDSCDCEPTEEWVRKVGEKFYEMREEEQRRKQEMKSREQILAEESGENGTGSREVKAKCPRCEGKGMVHIKKPNGVFEGTQCSECGGTGEKRLELERRK